MITLLRYLIIIVMSSFLVVAAVNYKYFICGPGEEHCASGIMPYTSYNKPTPVYDSFGGGTNMPKR